MGPGCIQLAFASFALGFSNRLSDRRHDDDAPRPAIIRVTHHACERFIERVAPCSFAEAKASILSHARALETAAAFGAEVVKLDTGHRLILQGETVVSVYPAHEWPRQCRNPYRQGGEA